MDEWINAQIFITTILQRLKKKMIIIAIEKHQRTAKEQIASKFIGKIEEVLW